VPKREGGAIVAMHRDRAAITLEPGGQVELSGAPHRTARAVTAEAGAFVRELDARLAGTGLRQSALGFTPFARVAAIGWVPKGRYAIMRRHMATSGPLGHHMMKGTAATQASYDFSDERDAARKVRAGTVLAPVVHAMFANSPISEGRPNGWKSVRGHVWTLTDPARTGFPEAASAFSFARWVDYLLDVPMMFTRHLGAWQAADGTTFRQWMTQGRHGALPDVADWDLHQTTVFPEVRVKHQIEVRMGDCVPVPLAGAFAALWRGLFYDDRALDAALGVAARLERYGTAGQRFVSAARHGHGAWIGGRRLVSWAEDLVEIARAGLGRLDPDDVPVLEPLVRLVARAESPADRLLAALDGRFTPDRVLALTHPMDTPIVT
jgi:glutamate--cysteine ligase